jgi:hypothetical protein
MNLSYCHGIRIILDAISSISSELINFKNKKK